MPERTSVDWYGQRLPNGMDGVTGTDGKCCCPKTGTATTTRIRGWCRHPRGTQAYEWRDGDMPAAREAFDANPRIEAGDAMLKAHMHDAHDH